MLQVSETTTMPKQEDLRSDGRDPDVFLILEPIFNVSFEFLIPCAINTYRCRFAQGAAKYLGHDRYHVSSAQLLAADTELRNATRLLESQT
jgi:hypothetical protein